MNARIATHPLAYGLLVNTPGGVHESVAGTQTGTRLVLIVGGGPSVWVICRGAVRLLRVST